MSIAAGSVQGGSSLRRRMLRLSAGILVVLVTTGILVLDTLRILDTTQERQTAIAETRQLVATVENLHLNEETGLRGYLATGDARLLIPLDDARRALPTQLGTLRRDYTELGGPTLYLQTTAAAYDSWLEYSAQVSASLDAGDLQTARDVELTLEGKRRFDSLRANLNLVTWWLERQHNRTENRLVDLQRQLLGVIIAQLGLLLLVVVGGTWALWLRVIGPVIRLSRASRLVADGDLGAPLPVEGAVEVRALAGDVRAMRDRLTADLHATRDALDSVEQAEPALGALGRALRTPVAADHGPLRVSARLDAATGVLAGDWFDVVRIAPTRYGLIVGDVAGHGPLSAVFALRLKHALATALRMGADPAQALRKAAVSLTDVDDELFATVFVALFTTDADRFGYASAGHPAGLLRHTGGGWEELEATGPLLSPLTATASWEVRDHTFRSGDELLVCTDGVLEARDEGGREFGQDGVVAVLADVGTRRPGQTVEAVMAAALRHERSGLRRDDQTVVHLERVGF